MIEEGFVVRGQGMRRTGAAELRNGLADRIQDGVYFGVVNFTTRKPGPDEAQALLRQVAGVDAGGRATATDGSAG